MTTRPTRRTDSEDPLFEPRVALASLSGRSDAAWARAAADHVGAAFLGGIALDESTRSAARDLIAHDREEFLPDDPVAFVDEQLQALASVSLRPAVNVRTTTLTPLRAVASLCAEHDAIVEVNAHCRQAEMCAAGAGESLLCDPARLARQVTTAADSGATVGVKVRTEVDGVDLPALAARLDAAGADLLHVDAMDSEGMIAEVVAATDCFVVANNGVRDAATTREYLACGADAVSVGRASDDPAVLDTVRRCVAAWFETAGPDRPAQR